MASESIKEIVVRTLDRTELILMVVGAGAFVLGAAKGIQYNGWLPIDDLLARVALMVSGGLSFAVGVLLAIVEPTGPHGIKITSPAQGQSVSVVKMQGTIKRRLPKDHVLWVVRIYRSGEFLPLRQAEIHFAKGIWEAKDCDVGGTPGDERTLAAFLVGPSTHAFFKYFKIAAARHNGWMDRQNIPKDVRDRYLPNIEEKTEETVECDRIDVWRSNDSGSSSNASSSARR
jgi:hypothetical protein